MHIKKNDTVILLKDISACKGVHESTEERRKWAHGKGDTAKVLRVIPADNRVVVEGVNYRYKHVRPSQDNPQGGRIMKEASIHASNVRVYCPKCETGTEVKMKLQEDGKKKIRTCKRCGEALGND